jgi:hypothetical protein
MMNIKLEFLGEPKLQFGHYFEHEDTKTGLAEYGPFGKNISGLHPSQIKLGFIGTRETISGAKEWVEACSAPIESENIKKVSSRSSDADDLFAEEMGEEDPQRIRYEKILNRDFVGFNSDSPFQCSFQMNERWDKTLLPREIDDVLKIEDKEKRIWTLVDLFDSNIKTLSETSPSPDIIILALTPEIIDQAHAVRISGNFFLNFRRAIKARAMEWDIPVQLLQRKTVMGKGSQLQEKATRAWNFCTAQYYKAEGIPWRPITLERDVCFIGISFYVAQDVNEKLTMRSSVAQAFDYMGQGLVLRGEPFEWDEHKLGRSPHLTRSAAKKLIGDTLREYMKVGDMPPRRVVIHKTSEYWGAEHDKHNELEGFLEGIQDVFPRSDSDLVALRQTGTRLFREGSYPPLRGTYFSLEEDQHFLFTMGYIPYLETYPGSYVPEPWQITGHHGSSAPKDILKEVLALTKMNVNNCAFADGTPITLSFSHKIGEIMKHIKEDGKVQPQYKFYM